jgi:hypothetical protein
MRRLSQQGGDHEDACMPFRGFRHRGHGAGIERCRGAKVRRSHFASSGRESEEAVHKIEAKGGVL